MNDRRAALLQILLTRILLLGLGYNGALAQTAYSQVSTWKTVSLPSRPMNIESNGNALWICGGDEMIAVSKDGGLSWDMKHRKAHGEVLLRIGFVGEQVGYAAGTHGLLLWTNDGGDNWTNFDSHGKTIRDVSFSDDRNGLRTVDSRVEITHDGGEPGPRSPPTKAARI